MECREIAEKLNAYNDGELSPAECREVEDHLCVCASCRKALEEIRQVDVRLRELPGIKASASFDAQLARRMKGSGAFRLLKSRAAHMTLAAGLLLVIGLVAFRWSHTAPIAEPLPSVSEELPNLGLLGDDGFLGVGTDDAGIGGGLDVDLALSDSQSDS